MIYNIYDLAVSENYLISNLDAVDEIVVLNGNGLKFPKYKIKRVYEKVDWENLEDGYPTYINVSKREYDSRLDDSESDYITSLNYHDLLLEHVDSIKVSLISSRWNLGKDKFDDTLAQIIADSDYEARAKLMLTDFLNGLESCIQNLLSHKMQLDANEIQAYVVDELVEMYEGSINNLIIKLS